MLFPTLPFTTPSGTSPLPPSGTHLLLTDTFTAKGDIVLFHLVISAINQSIPIIWLDLRSESLSSWETILKRLGTPLPKPPQFNYLSPSPLDGAIPLFDDEPTLTPTYEAILSSLPNGPSLLLLDGLSELTSIGFTPAAVSRFVRSLLNVTRERGGSLVSTLHADNLEVNGVVDWEGHELLHRLCRLGGAWWRVEGLSTGRSADVSGEISAIALGEGVPSVPKERAVQYRLEVGGVKVFAKGTGRGYL